MLTSGIESSEVLSFLKDVSAAWGLAESGILPDSIYLGKIFSLDFFLSLEHSSSRDDLLKLALEATSSEALKAKVAAAFLWWQVTKLRKLLPEEDSRTLCSSRLLAVLQEKTLESKLEHPYHFAHHSVIPPLDTQLAQLLWAGETIPEIARLMCKSSQAHVIFTQSLLSSVFASRLLQPDFFEALDDQSKILFISNTLSRDTTFKTDPAIANVLKCTFMPSLAEQSDDIPVISATAMALKEVAPGFLSREELELKESCDTLSELLLKLDLHGHSVSSRLVAWMLCCKLKWLEEWSTSDPASLDQILEISAKVHELGSFMKKKNSRS